MKALTFHGRRDVRVDDVPDPTIREPTDAIIRVTSSGLCGSDLHLYEVLGPFIEEGDVLGHEPMGIVEEVGAEATGIAPGDRVVVPFNISCGHCFMCEHGLQSQCETTQVRDEGMGAALFGYTRLYGQVPGGQAEFLRVPQAQYGPIKVPEGPPDDRFLFLSDVLPTAWQAVKYADVPDGGSLAVIGLGPIGEMACRVAQHLGTENVIGLDLVPDRLARAAGHGVRTIDVGTTDDPAGAVRELTGGRGPDAVIDAVGLEAAHGHGALHGAERMKQASRSETDRGHALRDAILACRPGGIVSIIGVYGGMMDKFPTGALMNKGLTVRTAQCHVHRYLKPLYEHIREGRIDPSFVVTHRLGLDMAPDAYETFKHKQDECVKVVLKP
jgi:threonine dehydrogenase-like Zn-dependent dehydrogenase